MRNVMIIDKKSPFKQFLLEMPVTHWQQAFPFSESLIYRMKSNLKSGQPIKLPYKAVVNAYSNHLNEQTCMDSSERSAHLERLLHESKYLSL